MKELAWWMTVLQFAVNLLLLTGADKLGGGYSGWKRMIPAAALGAGFGSLSLVWKGAMGLGWRIACLAAMGMAAFGVGRNGWRRIGIFLLLQMALNGVTNAMGGRGILPLLLAGVGIWTLSMALCDEAEDLIPVEIQRNGKKISILALRDTGNLLRDPISGERVLVVGGQPAMSLTGLTAEQLANPIATLAGKTLPGLRLIPYHSVGMANGMLLAMRIARVRIGGAEREHIVAFAPWGLEGQKYQAIVGGTI